MALPKLVKEKRKLMREYARLCGYNYPPYAWRETDYTTKEWRQKVIEATLASPKFKYTNKFLNRMEKLINSGKS